MNDLVFADLRIDVFEGGAMSPTRLFWNGRSTERDPGKALLPFFRRILRDAAAAKTSVEMHFERLEYCNSLTVATLIQMVSEARDQRTKVAMVYKTGLRWQKVIFDALRVLAKDDGLLELRGR